ncbi:MAG: SUMF1/EgtB/PvdO family nonheme iron enzyme, partial [Phycisphaerales bacterium]
TSRKLTEGAYAYMPASDPNLVALWTLDDGSGSRALDSSGNDNHGTLHGDPQRTTGKIGGALDFDGDGDYVDCGNPDIFNFDGQVTVGAWINLRSIPGVHRAIVAKGEDAWRLALTRKTPSFHFAVAGKSFGYPGTHSAAQATFGEWHHVCGTYDSETIRIYIDGQPDATVDYNHGLATNNFNLLIGHNPQSSYPRFWDGLIDEVFVFNRALSKDQIRVVMGGLSGPALAQKPSPADHLKTNSVGMKLVWIPPGEFMMGSKFSPWEVTRRYNGSPARYQNEHPQRKVTLTRGFWMAESEVTQAQYRAVMGGNPSDSRGDNLPVEMVSWHDAMEFCRKLSQREGRTYTLPTEAQWEYAARAGTDTAYCFGDDASQLGEYAWYGSGISGRHPVKTRKPNAFGLYDMHGNVWEWCLDWYRGSYEGLGHVDPIGPRSGQSRVARGGAWHVYAGPYRSALREGYNPDERNRYRDVGFRVVLLVAGLH